MVDHSEFSMMKAVPIIATLLLLSIVTYIVLFGASMSFGIHESVNQLVDTMIWPVCLTFCVYFSTRHWKNHET